MTPRPCPVRHGSFRHRQHGREFVRIPNVEQHAFGHDAAHLFRLEIDHEERLLSFNLTRIRSLFLDPCDDRTAVVSEVHAPLAKLFRSWYITDTLNCADADVELLEGIQAHSGLNGCWRHS